MSRFISVVSLLTMLLQPTLTETDATLNPVQITGTSGTCPSQEERENAIQNITASIQTVLRDSYFNTCGERGWHQVAYFNMSDSSQRCPSPWREYKKGDIRTCRRPQSSSGSCSGIFYTTGQQYSKVCGKAIGYQIGSPDAFGHKAMGDTIDSYYVYGVSVTHGSPRKHIWTFASGVSEGAYSVQQNNCPCSDPSSPRSRYPPSFVGNNYYCESGNPTDIFAAYHFYSSDPLWDGQQCESECCSNGKSPPWFRVVLPNTTTDDIEVRICIPQGSYDDVALKLLEIYIQ